MFTVNKKKILQLSTFVKYLLSCIFPLFSYFSHACGEKTILYFLTILFLIILLTDYIGKKHLIITYIINSIIFLWINAQFSVLFFGHTYITLDMLANLKSAQSMNANLLLYFITINYILLSSFLPINYFDLKKSYYFKFSLLFFLELFIMILSKSYIYSPLYSYCHLLNEKLQIYKITKDLSMGESIEIFKKDEIKNYRIKDSKLSDKPNIILIFTEGMSSILMDDERNIMPNVSRFKNQSINFSNYTNHTFATFMGLTGQLHSGYQKQNMDENHLPSLQTILKKQGYKTVMINTEPKHKDFTKYLESLDYDTIVTNMNTLSGESSTMTDKEAYEFLIQTTQSLHAENNPFFLTIYTFGTHAFLDSPDKLFMDGQSNLLNRFHNADYYFGQFFDIFYNSKISEDTILIFTTDHATYAEKDFSKAFPNYKRKQISVDTIPFIIFYKNVLPENINVEGRNSLDMAPTILDFLDITDYNCFLGESLFAPLETTEEQNFRFDFRFQSLQNYVSTENLSFTTLSKKQTKVFFPYLVLYNEAKKMENLKQKK